MSWKNSTHELPKSFAFPYEWKEIGIVTKEGSPFDHSKRKFVGKLTLNGGRCYCILFANKTVQDITERNVCILHLKKIGQRLQSLERRYTVANRHFKYRIYSFVKTLKACSGIRIVAHACVIVQGLALSKRTVVI